MNLSDITSADLKRLAALIQQKEERLAELSKINAELGLFGGAGTVAESVRRPAARIAGRKSKGPGRGQVKEAILGLLSKAGKGGISVKDIAAKLGAKDQ